MKAPAFVPLSNRTPGVYQNWEVLWVVKKKGRRATVVGKEFGNDFVSALDLYEKAKRAKKPFATLRSCNVGYPPPARLQPHYVVVGVKRKVKGRTKVVRVRALKTPMRKLNVEHGVWWCPYCRELRRFQHQDGFRLEGIFVSKPGEYCPICGISHRDHNVKRWNPVAWKVQVAIETPRVRMSNRGTTRKRSKSRR